MMNINQLIGRDEGKTLEFKRDLSSTRNILKTLLAVEVYPSGSRPHWLKREGPMQGVYVIRSGSWIS